MKLHQLARQINNEFSAISSMRIGKTMKHPDGRTVKITDGTFLDPVYCRVSNFWHWREVKPNGKLGKQECGYGW